MADATRPSPDANEVYALGRGAGESERLLQQADELAAESSALLGRVGLRRGDAVVDVGCGPAGVLRLLADRVSPGGKVVGLDSDAAHLAMAAEFVRTARIPDVELVHADARQTGLPDGAFDVVHGRTILVNVPDPLDVLREMVRITRPGGCVVGMEPDNGVFVCHPEHPAYTRLSELFRRAVARNGADPLIGRSLPELYRQAGLQDIVVETRAPCYSPGHTRRTIVADLARTLRPIIVDSGLATTAELDELDTALRQHLGDPRTVVVPTLWFLVSGRKPS